MSENDAREAVRKIAGDQATDRLTQFADLVVLENGRQNLIARSTVPMIWSRHILDSVQLLRCARGQDGLWIDIGTGGGFPGLVIALATGRPIMLIEPRRQRSAFLTDAARAFDLTNVEIVQSRIERVSPCKATIISARAVAPIGDLFGGAKHCSSDATQWLLPRGAGWQTDLTDAKVGWKGMFHVEQSLSDPAARIFVATQVRPR